MTKTVFLHGLGSSSTSFAYMAKFFDDPVVIDYDSVKPLDISINSVTHKIKEAVGDKPFNLVGHSLGGLIGAHLALNNEPINRLVTISSPLAGSKAARFLKYIVVGVPVFADVCPNSWHIQRVLFNKPKCPVLSIVTNKGGWSIFGQENDGTVECSSQKALVYAQKVTVAANHFEVLLKKETVNHIANFYQFKEPT